MSIRPAESSSGRSTGQGKGAGLLQMQGKPRKAYEEQSDVSGFMLLKDPWGFPGGAVVQNLPANAGDTGSIPGPGRSHMLQSNKARVPLLRLSLCSRACKPQLLSLRAATTEACVPRARAPQQEKPPQ